MPSGHPGRVEAPRSSPVRGEAGPDGRNHERLCRGLLVPLQVAHAGSGEGLSLAMTLALIGAAVGTFAVLVLGVGALVAWLDDRLDDEPWEPER